jgi:hypothetical protein
MICSISSTKMLPNVLESVYYEYEFLPALTERMLVHNKPDKIK